MSAPSIQEARVAALPNEVTCRLAFLYILWPELEGDRIARGRMLLRVYKLLGIGESDGEEIDGEVLALEGGEGVSESMRSWLLNIARGHLEGNQRQVRKLIVTNLGVCEAALVLRTERHAEVLDIHNRARDFLRDLCPKWDADRHCRFYRCLGRGVFYRLRSELANSPADSSFDSWLSRSLPYKSVPSARRDDTLYRQVEEKVTSKDSAVRSAGQGALAGDSKSGLPTVKDRLLMVIHCSLHSLVDSRY